VVRAVPVGRAARVASVGRPASAVREELDGRVAWAARVALVGQGVRAGMAAREAPGGRAAWAAWAVRAAASGMAEHNVKAHSAI
jgi:hypothetical protein